MWIIHRCTNPDCEGEDWDADMFIETGTYFYHDDDDADCPECEEEGEMHP